MPMRGKHSSYNPSLHAAYVDTTHCTPGPNSNSLTTASLMTLHALYLKEQLHVARLIVEASKSPDELRKGASIHVMHQRGEPLGYSFYESVRWVVTQGVTSPQQLLGVLQTTVLHQPVLWPCSSDVAVTTSY